MCAVALSQRSRVLLDSEYYATPQQDAASQLGVTQQPAQPQPPQPSAQEYIASTEHLYESQAPSPVSEYSIVKTGAGNTYVYTPSAGWQKLEYKPDTNTYALTPASLSDITAEINRLGGTGYKLDPRLAEKVAKEEPHALMWGGVEEALRYAKLRETFPELAKEKWITEADVQNVIVQRLESHGWRPTTREEYEALRNLARATLQNPDAWKLVQEDIERQLAEIQRRQEELQRFYEAKALKQWEAERETWLRQQIEEHYHFFEYADPITLFTSAVGRSVWRAATFGLGEPLLPRDTGYFYEALYERLSQLADKPFKPLVDLSQFLPEPLRGAHEWLKEVFGWRPNPWLVSDIAKQHLAGQERIEFEALEKVLSPEKRLAYGLGYALGTAATLGLMNLAFDRLVAPRVEKTLGGLAKYATEHPESRVAKLAEKLKLVQREQLVPKEVEVEARRVAEGFDRYIAARTRVVEWGRAEELLGGRVPEGMRLRPGEVSVLPLEGGLKAPVVGEGKVFAHRFKGLRFTWEKGWEPLGKEWFYARGAGEESLVAARLASERFATPRVDVAAVRARVDYAKVLAQAQGGLPKSVLLTEEGDILASVSRTPRIPVREVFRPTVERLPPLLPPPRLPVREEARAPQVSALQLPRLPLGLRADIEHPRMQPAAPRPQPVPVPPVLGDIAAVIPKTSVPAETAVPRQAPRLEPRLELPQLPRLAPKVELPQQLAAPASSPPPQPQRALPRLPAPPPVVGGGVRDVPVPRAPRLFGSREWLVRWFGPPEVIPAGRSRRGGRRRGGRK